MGRLLANGLKRNRGRQVLPHIVEEALLEQHRVLMRGFFGGLGAMATGQDERQAQATEQNAAAEQRRALEQRERTQQASANQQQSARELRSARTRLAALDADLAAFAQASQPLLSQYRKDPAIDALYRRIRDLA